MKKFILVIVCWLMVAVSFTQSISQRIENVYQQFEADSQLRHAISSLYVINAKTGKVVFDKNSRIGLAPASTQKIVTGATAFELLGKGYRYKTELGLTQPHNMDSVMAEGIVIIGHGDPTLGSWRYENTKPNVLLQKWIDVLKKAKVTNLPDLTIYADDSKWGTQALPGGWIWDDIGNYYGAGASSLNWRENQYDIYLRSGNKIGDTCAIAKEVPRLHEGLLICEVTAAAKGSGDNAYVYRAPYSYSGFIRGTIPVDEPSFKISASIPEPAMQLGYEFINGLQPLRLIDNTDGFFSYSNPLSGGRSWWPGLHPQIIYTHYSPSLDSIIYWFLQKSINLYGEALIKTFAYEKKGFGSTDSGVVIVKDFWKQKGLDEEELNIYDGSGLSPLNRVTTHAQVEVLKYAKTKDWFPYFYEALPTYNGMKMKSGSISDVKGFCGYQKASDGNEYIFSFLVNNYNGRSSTIVNKMYKVLDVLKQ